MPSHDTQVSGRNIRGLAVSEITDQLINELRKESRTAPAKKSLMLDLVIVVVASLVQIITLTAPDE